MTLLSWFLLPFSCMLMVFIHEIKFKLLYSETFGSDFIYVVLLNLPFVVGLIWTYSVFSKNSFRFSHTPDFDNH